MPGIKLECRTRHLTTPLDPAPRQAGDSAARGQYAALLPMREWRPAGAPGNPALYVCPTRGGEWGHGPGMEWPWVLGPASGLSASLPMTLSSRRRTA